MMVIDKNWYQLPEYEQLEVVEDYSEFNGDITLLGNFPHNVEQEIAFRYEQELWMGAFKLLTGLYVYYEIDLLEQKRYIVPLNNIYGIARQPFELEDINWNHFPALEEERPAFDLSDEV
jgi:hypothetical protein